MSAFTKLQAQLQTFLYICRAIFSGLFFKGISMPFFKNNWIAL
ncbi:RAxF-45 family protein [Scopulibacillus darangshiensis]|nr:RAxF-45 family protein [Scopulibacillus darangshiensis]